jgi:hypothetical protein
MSLCSEGKPAFSGAGVEEITLLALLVGGTVSCYVRIWLGLAYCRPEGLYASMYFLIMSFWTLQLDGLF